MRTFLEYYSAPEQHGLHNAATKIGFEHRKTTSAAGVSTHEYTHPHGHALTLKSGGTAGKHEYSMHTNRNKKLVGTTPEHFYGASVYV